MSDLDQPRDLVEEHFFLLEEKQELDQRIRVNQTQTVKALAKEGQFGLLQVNWTQARRLGRMQR